MSDIVRAALVQSEWTGDKASMVDKNVDLARQAAENGAQVLCFQEIFNTPYFCNVQDSKHYDDAEEIPDGPTVQRMISLSKETGMVLVVPIYERVDEGVFYNTAAVIDAGGEFLGIYRKMHIPHVEGFWEKFYFRPGNLGYPIFDTAVGRIGVYICYDRHFPEGWRALGLAGAKIVFNPSATTRGTRRLPLVVIRNISGSWSSQRPRLRTSITWVPSTVLARKVSKTPTTTAVPISSALGVRWLVRLRRTLLTK